MMNVLGYICLAVFVGAMLATAYMLNKAVTKMRKYGSENHDMLDSSVF